MKKELLNEPLLQEIVQRLVTSVDPDRIILFGSRASGTASPDSDIDLLLIKESSEPPHRRAIPAYRALCGLGVPKDILWQTPQEVEDWAQVKNHITTKAIQEGLLLYEKPQ